MGTDGATFPSVIGTKLTYQTAQQNKVYAAYSQNYLARMLAANNPTAMEFTKGDKAIQTSGIMAFELKNRIQMGPSIYFQSMPVELCKMEKH